MKKLIAISIFCFLGGTMVYGQQEITKKCGTDEAMEIAFKLYPELRASYEAHLLLENSKQNSSKGMEKSAPYVIPVVFHILHEYGSENLDDSQIYDAMRVINEEFNAADPDSVNIVPEYANLIGNGRIEFKLASKDPFGNCTNGINHIYSHETRAGDNNSKLNQWDRAHYLNIWVAIVIGSPGAAAYSQMPVATDGAGFWYDGVISNHTYVGSTGTSVPGREHVLTHEIGHYLNLAHVWGSTNDPGVACGDDGVLDTPITKGHNTCPPYPAGWIDCDTAGVILEDIHNYMEYTYCNYHFTPGQVDRMHNALEGIAGQRNLLWQDSTLALTGVTNITLPQVPTNDLANLTVPLCAPVADFSADTKNVCVGQSVSFSDASWNGVIGSRSWTFQNGTPATSTVTNPIVTFDTPGFKTVTLSATNAAGTGVESRTGYIYVAPLWADYTGPASNNLESGSANWFLVNNPEDNYASFKLNNGTGYSNSRSYKLNNFKDISGADLFNSDFFYNSRLGLNKDELITPSYDLRHTTNVTVSFKFSYATNATQVADIAEELRVYTSVDCGENWLPRNINLEGVPVGNSLDGSEIVTGGFAGYTDYVPTSNNDWKTASFTYTPSATLSDHVRFKFVFEASDVSSNLYIDDINVDGTLNIVSDEIALLDLSVFPNPTTNGTAINVSFTGQNEPVTFTLRDTQGKIISTEVVEATNTLVNRTLKNTENLGAACYFIEVQTGGHVTTKKVIVL